MTCTVSTVQQAEKIQLSVLQPSNGWALWRVITETALKRDTITVYRNECVIDVSQQVNSTTNQNIINFGTISN